MADAKKCDRCKKFYETYSPKLEVMENLASDPGEVKPKDLCPTCNLILEKFMKMTDQIAIIDETGTLTLEKPAAFKLEYKTDTSRRNKYNLQAMAFKVNF